MGKTMDVYEDRNKPSVRIRVTDDFMLGTADLSGDWIVVPTENGDEVAVDLRRATRLHVRERTEHDDRLHEEKMRVMFGEETLGAS